MSRDILVSSNIPQTGLTPLYHHPQSETVAEKDTPPSMRGMLSPAHLEFLVRQGIAEPVARQYCHSVTRLEHFPSGISRFFMLDETERTRAGLMFYWPVPGLEDVPQFRPDKAITGEDGEEKKYIFSKGCGSFVSVLREAEVTHPYLLCEGTKQTLAALSWAPKGWGIAGVPGCQNWRGVPMAWAQDHDIVIAFDKDTATNQAVHDAARALKHDLEVTWGASGVAFAQLPAGRSDDGLDDHLARIPEEGREGFLLRLVASVKKSLGRRPGAKKKELVIPPGVALFAPPDQPLDVARQLEPTWKYDGKPTLAHWQGDWMTWERTHWKKISEHSLRSRLYLHLEDAQYTTVKANGEASIHRWAPTKSKTENLADAIRALVVLDDETQLNTWRDLPEKEGEIRGTSVISMTNGLFDIRTKKLQEHNPAFFNSTSLPFAYDPDAPEPVEWLSFLSSVWGEDQQSIDTLQEWFGYVLSGRTDLHKIFSIVGPPRSGKGTIVEVLQRLIGKGNYAKPSLSNLTTNFGLEPLIGKMLAVVPDGRMPREGREEILERLLAVSGGDEITVDRKNEKAWTGPMSVRLMLVSNDLVTFKDSSGAIASRMVVLRTGQSFLGKEDTGIVDRVSQEMPGVLLWALEGLARLTRNGRLTQPDSSALAKEFIEEATSPIKMFVTDMCTVGEGLSVPCQEMYSAWERWCIEEEKRERMGTMHTLGKDLFSAVPGLGRVKSMKNRIRQYYYTGIALRTEGTEQDTQDPFGGPAPTLRTESEGSQTKQVETTTEQDVSDRYQDEPLTGEETTANLDVSDRYMEKTDILDTSDNWCEKCNQCVIWRKCRCG